MDAGSYSVQLVIKDSQGEVSTLNKKVNINDEGQSENEQPIAEFDVSTTELMAAFIDQSHDKEGELIAWLWSFGDGGQSIERHPVHHYSKPGAYLVSLTVTDSDSVTESISKDIELTSDSGKCTNIAAYESGAVYISGSQVSHNGKIYRANWWNSNDNPATNSGPYQVWTLMGDC